MKAVITFPEKSITIDLAQPLDISMPMRGDEKGAVAWYLPSARIAPHEEHDFVGSVSKGASTNFNNIWFNPHAHGTHTECLGHITAGFHSVNQALDQFFFLAEVVTVAPEQLGGDHVISKQQLEYVLGQKKPQALIIRTLPNTDEKKHRNYSNTNPPYLLEETALFLKSLGVEHLLVDLPSVDKEKDDGALLAHRAFWNMNGEPRTNATITEFIFVPNAIEDGSYMLDLQMAAFENDASPSRPILYRIEA